MPQESYLHAQTLSPALNAQTPPRRLKDGARNPQSQPSLEVLIWIYRGWSGIEAFLPNHQGQRRVRSIRSSFRSSTASTDSTGKWLRRIRARMRADSSVKENGFPK